MSGHGRADKLTKFENEKDPGGGREIAGVKGVSMGWSISSPHETILGH